MVPELAVKVPVLDQLPVKLMEADESGFNIPFVVMVMSLKLEAVVG